MLDKCNLLETILRFSCVPLSLLYRLFFLKQLLSFNWGSTTVALVTYFAFFFSIFIDEWRESPMQNLKRAQIAVLNFFLIGPAPVYRASVISEIPAVLRTSTIHPSSFFRRAIPCLFWRRMITLILDGFSLEAFIRNVDDSFNLDSWVKNIMFSHHMKDT